MNNESKNEKSITIIAQAFYGNRTVTEIDVKDIDNFILGHLSDVLPVVEPIDRTVVVIPGTDNIVLIYNKYQEEEELQRKNKLLKEEGYVLKPLAEIPEIDLVIYSRCIVCRMNEEGIFESIEPDDKDKFMKYLA